MKPQCWLAHKVHAHHVLGIRSASSRCTHVAQARRTTQANSRYGGFRDLLVLHMCTLD